MVAPPSPQPQPPPSPPPAGHGAVRRAQAGQVPEQRLVSPRRPRPGGGRRRRRATVALTLGLTSLMLLGATARLFVFPRRDQPVPVDAIVMFAGSPGRLEYAVDLAHAGLAPTLAVSVPAVDSRCPPPIPNVEVICFRPDPSTTQGESRWTADTAARLGWRSVLVVTVTTQTTRARLRLARCYDGTILMSPVAPPRRMWPYMIAYEWAAMGKALLSQREC